MIYLAIDPGKGGAIAWSTGNELCCCKMPENVHDLVKLIRDMRDKHQIKACLERVHSSPQMGVASAFTFGREYGKAEAVLASFGASIEDITPQKWMKAFTAKTRKDLGGITEWKKHLRSIALRLHPQMDINPQCADAVLILHWFIEQQRDQQI